ncbi:hypothetical protein [Streptomyces sp. NPDC088760]
MAARVDSLTKAEHDELQQQTTPAASAHDDLHAEPTPYIARTRPADKTSR